MKQNSRPIPFQFLPYPHPKKNKDESPSLYLAKTFTTLSPPALTTHRLSWLYATEHITTHDLIMWTDPRGPGWEVVEEFKLFYPRGSRQLRNPSHTAKLNISRIYAASGPRERTQSRLLRQMACIRNHHGCQEPGYTNQVRKLIYWIDSLSINIYTYIEHLPAPSCKSTNSI